MLTQPWPAGPTDKRRDQVIYYQYTADRARRTLRGIDEQIGKAERAVAGKVPVKRNRFVTLTGADKAVNRTLEAKARSLAGWKGAEFVIGAYRLVEELREPVVGAATWDAEFAQDVEYLTRWAGRQPRSELISGEPFGAGQVVDGERRSCSRPASTSRPRSTPGRQPAATGGVYQRPSRRTREVGPGRLGQFAEHR